MTASSIARSTMACEACSAKFSLFKRKKQCMDCLRHFCSECVIKRLDKMLSCDSCCMLSRRPLVRSQIAEMRSRDLRQYLLAKRVCVKGCVEKGDLINLLMLLANGTNHRSDAAPEATVRSGNNNDESIRGCPSNRSDTCSVDNDHDESGRSVGSGGSGGSGGCGGSGGGGGSGASGGSGEGGGSGASGGSERNCGNESTTEAACGTSARIGHIEIEEIEESDSSPNELQGPEPLITEQDDSPGAPDEQRSDEMFTEIPVWSDLVKLSDINDLSELEYLNVKQLKNLLSTNRVDYKGCIERSELLDRVSRLWEEYKQSRADIEKLDEGDLCKICWDAPIECVILECGHMACCINCGKQMSECPICKQYVVRVVRFFKA